MQQRCIRHVHLSNQEEEEQQREESYVYVYLGIQVFFSVVRTCIAVVCFQSSIHPGWMHNKESRCALHNCSSCTVSVAILC